MWYLFNTTIVTIFNVIIFVAAIYDLQKIATYFVIKMYD